MVTHKDGRRIWIDDAVTSLRFLDGDRPPIPLSSDVTEYLLGSADDCTIQVQDGGGLVSRHHARLSRTGATWMLQDLDSTNGVMLDGARRLSFELTPGAEIEIGDIKLIADSAQLAQLREFVSRIIGWAPVRRPHVDAAVRALRQATTRRAAFVLTGDGDLTSTARRLHALAFGEEQPFLVEPKRGRRKLRRERQWQSSGTTCFVADDLPPEFVAIAAASRMRADASRIMLCAASRDAAATAISKLESTVVVEIPPLSGRPEDLDRLIQLYATDAVAALKGPGTGFRENEMLWLRRTPIESLGDLEELMLRLVAARIWGTKKGGRQLGISHVALGRWLRSRGIPT